MGGERERHEEKTEHQYWLDLQRRMSRPDTLLSVIRPGTQGSAVVARNLAQGDAAEITAFR